MHLKHVFVYFMFLLLAACGGGGNGGSGGDGTGTNIEEPNVSSDLTEPKIVSFSRLANGAQLLALSKDGSLLYVGNTAGLHVFDVTDPFKPLELYFLETPDQVRGFELSGDGQLAYLSATELPIGRSVQEECFLFTGYPNKGLKNI